MSPASHYTVLGVPADASGADIRAAYRRAMRAAHPDVSGEGRHGHAVRLNEAYAVLIDPDARAAYDLTLAVPRPRPTPEPSRYAPPSGQPHGFDTGSWDIPDWPR